MRYVWILFLLVGFAACSSGGKKDAMEQNPASVTRQTDVSDSFNLSFGKLLTGYYILKDDFVKENEEAINDAARLLITSADSLELDQLQADSSLRSTAGSLAMGISAELKGLLGEITPEGKKRSFQMISDQLYDLIQTVHYNREKVYHIYCSLAFPDQGAYWLNDSRLIKNPYSPQKMMNCGEVKDSLDYRSKK